uniref:IP05614p n=2 Tax=Drosophila melanogaster TaxID=7227 RepID=Q4V696_DROME|nr:IP05614p [Drosophila melanogaster]
MGGQSESDQDFKVAGLVLRVLHKKLCAQMSTHCMDLFSLFMKCLRIFRASASSRILPTLFESAYILSASQSFMFSISSS